MISLLRKIDAAIPTDLPLGRWFQHKVPAGPLTAEDLVKRDVRRNIISFLGLLAIVTIPLVMLVDNQHGLACERNSLSAYYFSPLAGSVFVSIMSAIGVLLLAYRGESRRDTWLAILAGIAAICIGIFSTTGPGFETVAGAPVCDARIILNLPASTDAIKAALQTRQFDAFEGIEFAHYAAVGVLFGIMFLFSTFLFRMASTEDRVGGAGTPLTDTKVYRNSVYLLCSLVMFVSAIGLAIGFQDRFTAFYDTNNLTLWIELASFEALGVAWLVKGRFFNRYLKN